VNGVVLNTPGLSGSWMMVWPVGQTISVMALALAAVITYEDE
jgi:hypothetical protein